MNLLSALQRRSNDVPVAHRSSSEAAHDGAARDTVGLLGVPQTKIKVLGVAKFEKGDFQGAAANLLRSVDLTNDLYAILLRYLARARAGETSALAELQTRAGRLNAKNWPYAMIEFYLGRRTPEQALAAAGNPDQYCQAQFYIGQWHLVKGNAALAAAPLQAAIATCPKDFIEFTGAVAELKRMQPQKTTDTALAAKR